MALGEALLIAVAVVAGLAVLVTLIVMIIVPTFRGIGAAIRHVAAFVVGEVGDAARMVGAAVVIPVYTVLALLSVLVGRWSASKHFFESVAREFANIGTCAYRMTVGHPLRLFGLGAVTEGLERRLPEVIRGTPGADTPNPSRTGQFDGYRIVGSLPGGGSGGKLYIAEPDPIKLASLQRSGYRDIGQVVIKSFSLKDGSSLPQIVRESRALEAAKKLGLVLDNDLTAERFFYVMRYVPGQSLSIVTQQLHASSNPIAGGLDDERLRRALSYVGDLLQTLDGYHRGGLWHKDVKPDNIIVDGQRAHLVDFGLVTPLRSAMTLTTHGTEYFRDPEMVRMALKGAKVHEVDGTRFDIYAAGCVLYSVIENSFPAHGALSQVSRRCPDAVKWIIRRAMTDYDKRYTSASAMLQDLTAVLSAADPMAVKPGQLPSMGDGVMPEMPPPLPVDPFVATPMPPHRPYAVPAAGAAGLGAAGVGAAGLGAEAGAGVAATPAARKAASRVRVTNWWTGAFHVEPSGAAPAGQAGGGSPRPRGVGARGKATEQLARARERIEARRDRARSRLSGRATSRYSNEPSPLAVVGVVAGILAVGVVSYSSKRGGPTVSISMDSTDSSSNGVEVVSGDVDMPPTPPTPPPAVLSPAVLSKVSQDVESAIKEAMDGKNWEEFSARWAKAGEKLRSAMVQPRSEGANAPAAKVASSGAKPAGKGSGKNTSKVAPPAPVHLVGRILFIADLMPPLAPEHEKTIAGMIGRLKGSGLEVVGKFPAQGAAGAQLEVDDDLVAHAMAAAGPAGPETDTARKAVEGWLSGEEDLDAVVWVSPKTPQADGGKAPVPLRYQVVTARHGDDSDADYKARLALVESVRGLVSGKK